MVSYHGSACSAPQNAPGVTPRGLRTFFSGIVGTTVINSIINSGFYYGCSMQHGFWAHTHHIKCSRRDCREYNTFVVYTELLKTKELPTLYFNKYVHFKSTKQMLPKHAEAWGRGLFCAMFKYLLWRICGWCKHLPWVLAN